MTRFDQSSGSPAFLSLASVRLLAADCRLPLLCEVSPPAKAPRLRLLLHAHAQPLRQLWPAAEHRRFPRRRGPRPYALRNTSEDTYSSVFGCVRREPLSSWQRTRQISHPQLLYRSSAISSLTLGPLRLLRRLRAVHTGRARARGGHGVLLEELRPHRRPEPRPIALCARRRAAPMARALGGRRRSRDDAAARRRRGGRNRAARRAQGQTVRRLPARDFFSLAAAGAAPLPPYPAAGTCGYVSCMESVCCGVELASQLGAMGG